MSEKDNFYGYGDWKSERLHRLLEGWDGLGGNHGTVIKFCADLIPADVTESTVLDVGCGLCHLYEVLKDKVAGYVGVDNDERIVEWAKERYPLGNIYHGDVNDLSLLGDAKFDYVFAIGLYRRAFQTQGIYEMLKHTKKALILTYLEREGSEPPYFPDVFWNFIKNEDVYSIEVMAQNIKAIEIVKFNV